MGTVTSEQVAEYRDLVESLAIRLQGGQANAEFDDLVQEGLICVWQCLAENIDPGPGIIVRRMKNWRRFLLRHGTGLSYEEVMERDPESLRLG